MAKEPKQTGPRKIKLKDDQIHRLVFETFGLRRYTQDSPIQPDVWTLFLKLAADRNLENRIALILTPKETPSKDGQPPGSAAQLAEEIREKILTDKGLLPSPEGRGQERANPDDEAALTLSKKQKEELGKFKIASTARHVVINANFEEVLRYLLPITAWWTSLPDRLTDTDKLLKTLAGHSGKPIREALVAENTEFLRFAALTAITAMIGVHDDTRAITKLISYLALPRPSDDPDLEPDRPRGSSGTVKDLKALWEHYLAVARRTFEKPKVDGQLPAPSSPQTLNAASIKTETLIWSIQRNRMAQREVAEPLQSAPRVLAGCEAFYSTTRLSRQTVKADAAIMLFSISTKDLTWAVIDTGIDADHDAFKDLAPDSIDPTRTRVVVTLDFTRLRGLLAEDLDVDKLLEIIARAPDMPEELASRRKSLQSTLNSIRRRNVNGRELDWTLLEPLIRVYRGQQNWVPTDPHGTHVAGILGGRLPEGVDDDKDPFVGICPEIRFYDLRVFGEDPDGRPTGGDEFTILAALDYIEWANRDAERPRIHGVNLSLSIRHVVDAHACGRTPVCAACNRLVGSGTVVVAAAGNAGYDESQRQGDARIGLSRHQHHGPRQCRAGDHRRRNTPHRSPCLWGELFLQPRSDRRRPGKAGPRRAGRKDQVRRSRSHHIDQGRNVDGGAARVGGLRAAYGAPSGIHRPAEAHQGNPLATATDLGRERSFQGAGLVDALRALQSV